MTKNISLNGAFIKRDKLNDELPLTPIVSEIDFSFDFITTRRYIDVAGKGIHHGKNDDSVEIWFKKIDERNKEFIKRFILDYL